MEQDKILNCENCNAPIPADAPKCPYCGALNAVGGEKKYMETLFELKEDVEELKTTPVQAYKEELKKTGRIIRRTVFGVIIAAFCIWGLYLWLQMPFNEKKSIEDVKAQHEWEKENFPKLDELYAAKDYDGILEFEALNNENGRYSMSEWEHYDFINDYRWYMIFKEDAAAIESGNYDKDNVYWCIWAAMFLKQNKDYVNYTDEELEYSEEYLVETNEFLKNAFGMEQEEIDKLYDKCCNGEIYGNFFSYYSADKEIKSYIKKKLKIK